MSIKSYMFEVVQQVRHPETGEPLLSEETIKQALEHKQIGSWAYVLHDKDAYTDDDEAANPEHKAGRLKPAHWHVVIRLKTKALEISVIAKWFRVPENFVKVKKGRDAFLDSVQYLTHESEKQQRAGKHRYDDSEIKTSPGFDFRDELIKRAEKAIKYGMESIKESLRKKVLLEGMTIRQIIAMDPLAYQKDYSTLDKFRIKYISDYAPLPRLRINYYVSGCGGVGKGLICRAIARSLYPDLVHDEDIFFEVGAKNAAFEGYDGQPVIIWNDRRAIDLLQELGGRGNVFNVFDTHPTRAKQNIKYGSVNLCNEVNIVNSVQSYSDFLDGLAGEYTDRSGVKMTSEDKGQSYRRFPFIIPLHENDFDLLMNKGFYEGTTEYEQYIAYHKIRGNMQKIAQFCGTNEALAHEIQAKTVKPITDKHMELKEKHSCTEVDEEAIRDLFKDYGSMEGPTVELFPGGWKTIA